MAASNRGASPSLSRTLRIPRRITGSTSGGKPVRCPALRARWPDHGHIDTEAGGERDPAFEFAAGCRRLAEAADRGADLAEPIRIVAITAVVGAEQDHVDVGELVSRIIRPCL